mmetsp:Transcript_93116/g.262488  ORF Transcript_93116/g.262488 Transcript_93116/m.262488 type:complete len:293 (-) Transcript_93116:207-1085(-)
MEVLHVELELAQRVRVLHVGPQLVECVRVPGRLRQEVAHALPQQQRLGLGRPASLSGVLGALLVDGRHGRLQRHLQAHHEGAAEEEAVAVRELTIGQTIAQKRFSIHQDGALGSLRPVQRDADIVPVHQAAEVRRDPEACDRDGRPCRTAHRRDLPRVEVVQETASQMRVVRHVHQVWGDLLSVQHLHGRRMRQQPLRLQRPLPARRQGGAMLVWALRRRGAREVQEQPTRHRELLGELVAAAGAARPHRQGGGGDLGLQPRDLLPERRQGVRLRRNCMGVRPQLLHAACEA